MTYEEYIYFPKEKANGKFVHKNNFSIYDEISLLRKEHEITLLNLDTVKKYPKGSFDKKHLINFNKFLFGHIYPFAGEFKKWDLGKGQDILGGYSVRYCPVQYIESSIDDCCNKLKALKKETPIYELAKQIADNWAYLWQIHAFYEGNTRTTALFMTELLKSKGIEFNKEVMAKSYHNFRNALVLYTVQKEDKLNNLILEGLQLSIPKEINERRKDARDAEILASLDNNTSLSNEFISTRNRWINGEISDEEYKELACSL